jgi:hypothetical protein
LVRWLWVARQGHRRLLRLYEEPSNATDAERVVGGAHGGLEVEGCFDNNVSIALGVPRSVVDVPPQRLEEGIQEVASKPRLLVRRVEVLVLVRCKLLAQPCDRASCILLGRHLMPHGNVAYHGCALRSRMLRRLPVPPERVDVQDRVVAGRQHDRIADLCDVVHQLGPFVRDPGLTLAAAGRGP